MSEERTTRVETPVGETHTHTEIIREREPRRSGTGGTIIIVLLVLIALVGGFVLVQGQSAEAAKDNAIADAANSVGDAAQSIGNAADTAADRIAN